MRGKDGVDLLEVQAKSFEQILVSSITENVGCVKTLLDRSFKKTEVMQTTRKFAMWTKRVCKFLQYFLVKEGLGLINKLLLY